MLLWFDNNITNNSKGGYSNEKICFKKFVSYYNCFNEFGFIGEIFAQAQETNFENWIKIQQDKVS